MLWWRVGSENTNAAENDHMNRNPLNLLRQTTEKERLRVLQVVDLSVLAAASFRIVITLSLLFLSAPPPVRGTQVARLSLIWVYFL